MEKTWFSRHLANEDQQGEKNRLRTQKQAHSQPKVGRKSSSLSFSFSFDLSLHNKKCPISKSVLT